jgi:hypothetical protein
MISVFLLNAKSPRNNWQIGEVVNLHEMPDLNPLEGLNWLPD